jgi:hypothetical protein
MLKLKVNGSKYRLKSEFLEVDLNTLKKAYEYLNDLPFDLKAHLEDDSKSVKESKLIDFKVNWVALFCDIPLDVLKRVKVEGLQDISIEYLYEQCKKFIYSPRQYVQLDSFKLNGNTYNLVKETETISGASIMFGEGTFNQWKLSNMLTAQIQKDLSQTTVDCLVQLLAVLYINDNDNSDEAIEQRTKDFYQLDALTAWSCYFFFVQLLSKWKSFFQSYTEKTRPQLVLKMHKMILKEKLLKLFSAITFGASLRLKSLNYRFMVLDWNA